MGYTAYNVRIYHYSSGKQIRCYEKPIYPGEERPPSPEFVPRSDAPWDQPTFFWKSDFKDGWEHMEPDPEEKRERSVRSSTNRSKNEIYGIARANEWTFFLTLTFDRNKTDSADYDLIMKRCSKWLNNLKIRYCPNLRYLIVPELHADKEHWHLHGLLGDADGLKLLDSGHRDAQGRIIYNLQNWRYGFSTVTEVGEQARVSSYITKYITKDLCDILKNKHRYLVSNNCLRAKDVCEECLLFEDGMGTLMESISPYIRYAKSERVLPAHQIVSYFELSEEI